MQTQKWVNLALLIATGLVFLFFQKLVVAACDLAGWSRWENGILPLDVLIAVLLASGIGLVARYGSRSNNFLNEVVQDLAKVTWPMRKETITSAGVVVVLVGIAAVLLALIDLVWGTTAKGIFSI